MRNKENIRYEIDSSGRLSLMRAAVDGEFKIDEKNRLTWRVKKSLDTGLPRQLKLSGKWSLNAEHDLEFVLDKENNQRSGGKVTLEGEIIDARADSLVFSVITRDSGARTHLYLLKLNGKWQADRHNRITFLASKGKGLYDELVFGAAWEVDERNQLSYTYSKAYLKRTEKITRTIVFKGCWDITQKNRLSYVLNKEIGSGLEFQVSSAKPAKRGLEYEVGIGVAPAKRKITLLGSWKIKQGLGLLFEMPYEEGRLRSIVFGAACRMSGGRNLEFKLRNNLNKDLGINLKLTKEKLFGAGDAFLEAVKDGREVSIRAGVGFRW